MYIASDRGRIGVERGKFSKERNVGLDFFHVKFKRCV